MARFKGFKVFKNKKVLTDMLQKVKYAMFEILTFQQAQKRILHMLRLNVSGLHSRPKL